MWLKLVYLARRRAWWLAIELAVIGFVVTLFIYHDTDLSTYYLPVAGGDLSSGYVPYFAYWFLWPLAWFPTTYAWQVWSGMTLILFLFILYHRRVNPLPFLLSFSLVVQLWTG